MKIDKIPRLSGEYVNVYRPTGAVYPGPDVPELCHGQWYDEWVPNDHTFAVGPDGSWHLLGITHPLTTATNVHEGEVQLFHAVAAAAPEAFADRPLLLPPTDRPGEIPEIHSPFIVKRNGLYHMIYGPTYFRLAVSADLENWTLRGELFQDRDGGSRDPQIMEHDGKYHLCYCSGHEVRRRESADLIHWGPPQKMLSLPLGMAPESPFMICRDRVFYLLVCTWDGNWDERTVTQAYQHKALVFAAASLEDLGKCEPITTLETHAPEIIQYQGRDFISSAEWPYRGINLAPLNWE